jgi:hypothetical protein
MTQQAKAGTPKGTGKTDTGDRGLRVVVSDNRPDTNPSGSARKSADVRRVSPRRLDDR